jgi:hypothetical protein
VTIPGLGDPYFSSVSLLLHMDGTGGTFVDSSSSPKTVTAYGNATQSVDQSKFGGKSAYFDGAGDYLTVPPIAFGTNDFCIEMWFRSSSRTQYAQLIGNEGTGGFTLLLNNNGAGQVAVYGGSGLLLASSGDWTDGQWHHVALVRTGNSFSLYLDGTRNATGTSSSSFSSSSNVFIATNNNTGTSRDYAGYIDDLRVTLGTNRGYEGASISVPAKAFLDYDGLTLPVTVTGSGGGSGLSWSSAPASATATGAAGEIAYDGDNLWVATAANTWKRTALTTPVNLSYLVVGGGGGGGRYFSGGGGAGGYRSGTTTITAGTAYAVVVGGGGAALTASQVGIGSSGSASSFAGIESAGGGYGAGSDSAGVVGGSGGSGGGGGGAGSAAGGAGNTPATSPSQGNNGGATTYGGAGGGGAGGVGIATASGSTGGSGASSTITGTAVVRAGGGGGSAPTSGSGSGGGGNGATDNVAGTSGATNTGSGGGGGSYPQQGGNGGSGVVIIRAPVAAASTTGSPTVSTVAGETVYVFTSTGSITF